MTDLFEKSIHTLELPRVLELLAGQAVSEEAKDRCRALRPSVDGDGVARLLAETSAARTMMDTRGTPSFSGVKPVAAIVQRADLGGMLNTRELLDIAGVLKTARSVGEYGSGDERKKTCIDALFRCLTPNKYLEERITGSIVGEGELADAASPELANIRRHIRLTENKAREVLQKIISHSSRYLQENLVTLRGDRYVVPVKAECKGDVPGLVHDVSSSGSTYFIEPMGVVQANNELKEWQAREEKEIERILRELSAEAAKFREEITTDYEMLVTLDGIFARGKLSYRMNAMEPRLAQDGSLVLRHARHPLLDSKKAVPIDLRLGTDFDTLVITGPNTGGKTVALKTLGLLTLMAQCGLHLPVDDGSHVSVFDSVLSDIGDEQSIEQSLSTFSSHMTNTVKILAEAGERTMILFDELGAGTDPIEGAALAVAIIEEARNLGARVGATTHYAELKVYAMTTPGVENASCEFDVETLRPTYRLLIGVPGKSNAFAISRRLGLPEHIIDRASEQINAENVQFEDVLSQLESQRQAMEGETREAARLRQTMEEDAAAARAYRKKLEAERDKALEQARKEARTILDEARAASDQVFQELSEMRKKQRKEEDWQAVNEQRAELRRRLNEADGRLGARPEEEVPPPTRPAQKGDTVELLSMGTQATVLSVNKDGVLQLQAGILKISAKQEEVRVVEGETAAQKETRKAIQRSQQTLRTMGAKPEVDLRGLMTDEALAVLDRFLDDAMLAKLESVTIIHGKGTGAVRKAVRDHLRRSRYIKSFRPGRYGEGEDGVTVAELK
ncbi:MAG: endonuclease MutS2 [Oscillospiraceae bacterium]|nr:endonuclease MutS2 [Oscillospiraceae bacterium]